MQLTGIFYKRSMGRAKENLSCLREDADAYLQVAYRLGLAYYFLAGESGDKTAAAGWLSQAADQEMISRCEDHDRAVKVSRDAEVLRDLCEYYSMNLTVSGSRKNPDPADLWEKLMRLLQAGKEDDAENEWILREWLQIFYDNMDSLRRKVGEEEISTALQEVRLCLPAADEAGADSGAQEPRAFYDLILEDWNVLRGRVLNEGEGE